MKAPKRQIVAMGGGGFTIEPDNPLLERYILAQARTKEPSVCFLPTATGDADGYVARYYAAFTRMRCHPTRVTFFGRTPDLKKILLAQDVIYVGGGNTKSMLAVWHDWGVPELLRRAWRGGTVLAGISAGAICWFETGITDSWAGHLAELPCLGLLPGTCCPHYDGEPERRPTLRRMVADGTVPPALALDDGAAAHFVDRKLARVVVSLQTARGYRVHRVGSESVETPLPATQLRRDTT